VKRVAILISGGGSNMLALVRSMVGDHPARCVLVASNDPGAAGLERAGAMGIATAGVNHRDYPDRAAFEAALLEPILAADPDILCLAGFMRVLTPGFVDRFKGRMLNIHPSLLPKYPGLQTHQRALDAGDTIAGCTVHEVTPVLDDGPLLGQATVPILPGDTADTLSARVLVQEHSLYPATLRRFASGDRTPLMLSSSP
jgi:phosphoribosylglycinamide formyltransferase 1